jgi:hypothetical protein
MLMVKIDVLGPSKASPHWTFAHPEQSGKTKIQVQLDMKQDFKRNDTNIKDIPSHTSCLVNFEVATMSSWAVEKWNSFDTKSSLSLMKHTWSFYNFCNWKLSSYTSPQMVLLNHSMVYISSPRHWCFAFFPTSNKLQGKIRVKHTCITYIAKSDNGSMEKNIIHSKMCVEVGWSWLLHNNDSFSILYLRAGLSFLLDYGPKCVLIFL